MSKKILIPLLMLGIILPLSAVDMQRRLSFGVGTYTGSPLVLPQVFNVRFGIKERFVLEPILGFSYIGNMYGDSSETFIKAGIIGNYVIAGFEMANIYGHFGLALRFLVSKNPSNASTSASTIVEFPLGFGFEWFRERWSIIVNTESGLSIGDDLIDFHLLQNKFRLGFNFYTE